MPASIILAELGIVLTGIPLAAATFAINFVVSGIVARMFSVDQNANSSIDNGVRQQVAPATTNSLPIVYGDAYLGGTFVDAVLTTDQKVMYYVMAISSISPNGQFLYNRSTTVNAGSFAVGTIYTITTVGTTNFTLIGASANTVGVTFICTGAGTGTGTATKGNFYYGDRIVTFDATDPTKVVSLTDGAGNVDSKISGNLYINLYTSTDAGVITNVTGTAPSTFMGGSDIATALRWTGTRQMNGLAFAIAKLTYSVEAGTTQLQPITFNVSHYLNNTGAAKPGDVWFDYIGNETYGGGMLNNSMPTTSAGSFVVGSTYKIASIGTTSFTSIGAVSNNVGVWFTATGAGTGTGTAILSTLINRDSAIALNTYSDATITYTPSTGGSATQVRYRINGVLDTGQNVLSNIDKIMLACDSWNQYNAASGQWTVVVNRDASSSFSFDDTNVIGEIKTSLIDISNSINQIEASFPNKMNRDQSDVVYLETPTGLLYANEPLNKYSCSFDLVNESVQATYIANRMLEQAREDLIVTINAAYPAIQVDAGDVVSLTNTAYGWDNKLFRAMKVSEVSLPDGNLGASLDLSEYNAAVYDNGSITQYSPTPNSNLASVQFFSGLNPPVVSYSNPTATVPFFNVEVTTPAIGRVTAIGVFYTTVATPSLTDWTILYKSFAPTNGALANSTTFTFPNLQLPANTYYFGALVMNETGQSAISGVSASFIWIPTGTVGSQTAQVYLYQWALTSPAGPTGNSTYTWATATNSGYTGGGGWSVTIPANPGTANWQLWQAGKGITAFAGTATTNVAWAGSAITSIAQNGATGTSGTNGTRTALLSLFQWASTLPTTYPSGTSTYTWATGAFTNPATLNGWSQSPGAGSAGQNLYEIDQRYSDQLTTTISTVTWSSTTVLYVGGFGSNGATGATGATGASGTKSITVSAYQWLTSTPSIPTQPFTYTWSTGAVSAYPAGWTAAAPAAPGSGYTLYQINVIVTDLATATTSTTNWSNSQLNTVGYRLDGSIGPQGNNARLMYGKTTSGTIFAGTDTTSGGTSYPDTGLHFGVSGITWQASPPTLSVNESLFQSDGIYTTGGSTLWQTPYLSNLKVGSLSAISANLGVVNISTSGNLNSGKTSYTDTTAGFFLGNDSGTPRLAIGNATNSMQWTGSALNITGNITGASSIDITGSAKFGGAGTGAIIGFQTAAGMFNNTYTADFGLVASSNNTSASAIYGYQNNTSGTSGTFLAFNGTTSNGGSIGNPNADIILSSGRLKFQLYPTPSTDPNTLDAYQEGTWAPTFTNFGTVSASSGTYTKIGKVVTFSVFVQVSASGSSASISRFTLPYNPSGFSAFSVFVQGISAQSSGGFYQALCDGTNSVQVSYVPNGSSGSFFAGSLVSGSVMVFTGSYVATV